MNVPRMHFARIASWTMDVLVGAGDGGGGDVLDPPRGLLPGLGLRLSPGARFGLRLPPQLDLQALGKAYRVERLAIFDHFAYSPHLEVGVHLRRRAVGEGEGAAGVA